MEPTDQQLQQIMENSRKRVFGSEKPPEPVKVQTYPVQCGQCDTMMQTFTKPDEHDLPPVCEACRVAEDEKRKLEVAARFIAEEAAYAAHLKKLCAERLAVIRADLPGVLCRCGVPLRWRAASFDECPDLPKTIVKAAQTWAERPTGMVLYAGPAGAGKSWLAVAVLRAVLSAPVFDPKFVKYVSEAAYLDDLRASFSDGDTKPKPKQKMPRDHVTRIPLLLFDDLGSTRLTPWGAGAVAELIAARHAEDLATIVTSNLTLAEIADAVDGRTASRLADDKQVYKFPAKDLRVQGKVTFRDRIKAAIKAWGNGPKMTGPPE